VLQQDLELPQDLLGHRRESLHPADRERVCRAQATPRGTGQSVGTAYSVSCLPGKGDPPWVLSPREGGPRGVPSPIQKLWRMKVQAVPGAVEAFLREGSKGLLWDQQAAFLWQENTAFMSHF